MNDTGSILEASNTVAGFIFLVSMTLLASLNPSFIDTLVATTALGCACAVLSLIVVLRRWAFIGEGIGHSGLGGAGTAWLAALIFPGLDGPGSTYAFVVCFCLLTSVAIGYLSRSKRVNADAAIGIFLVASLAWGFLAQQIYFQQRQINPYGFDTYLFGQIRHFGGDFALAAIAISAAVILTTVMLWKQILAYCFDPLMAQTSGVPTVLVHYLLMILIGLVIIIGVRLVGSVLVTALLVLPGTTALSLCRRMRPALILAITVTLVGALGGLLVNDRWSFIPVGPSIVLILFIQFILAYAAGSFRRAG
jgi:ABC-type Mn2+/Zn2+ transport system permease subunit